jgi:hypothetical protein
MRAPHQNVSGAPRNRDAADYRALCQVGRQHRHSQPTSAPKAMINTTNISSGTVMVTLQVVPALWGLGGGEPGPALWGRADGKIPFPKPALVHNLTISRARFVTSAGFRIILDDDRRRCGMRRTIKLTDRQAEMVLSMFVGNERTEHYTNEEIRELVTLIWEWQWGVGRSLLEAIGSPHEPTYLVPQQRGDRPPNQGSHPRRGLAGGEPRAAAAARMRPGQGV